MKKRSPRQTLNKRLYDRQVKRIKQFIRRAEKRGYQFNENVLPKEPKKITKASITKLTKITPEKLYKKAVYGGKETSGVIVKGTEGRKLELKARAQKAAQTRKRNLANLRQDLAFIPPENISKDTTFFDATVITGFRAHVRQFNERASELLLNWLDRILQTNDAHDVATMLNDGAQAGNIVTFHIVYSVDKLYEYMASMLDYLPEAGLMFKEEMMDAMEMEEDFSSPYES